VLKTKPTLIKELQKLAKQAITPTSRRNILKSVAVPQTTKAQSTGKSYESQSKKAKLVKSQTNTTLKKSSSKLTPKNSIRDLSSKKTSETDLHQLKKSSEKLLKQPSTPKSSLKLIRNTPRSGSSSKKSFSILTSQKPKTPKLKRTSNKLIMGLCSKTLTGTINGKPKANNQDEFFIISNFAQNKSQTLIGVMDGHGIYGHEVSAFVKRQLPLLIENNLPYEVTSSEVCSDETLNKLKKAFVQGFMNTHKALINKRIIDINYSGTTAVTVLIRDKFCICSNVGDSRAIIGRFNEMWFPIELSHDHKPNDKLEKVRILEAGGRVEPFQETGGQFIGPDRVWLQHEQLPGLAMSRSIGDLVAAHVGVISEPEVIFHELTSFDKFIVVASDGIWEFISSHHCVRIVSEYYQDNNIEKACDALMVEAVNHWNKEDNVVDDITFVVVFLNDKVI
jgi:serine/threonine protein phosphatase PrpC